MRRAANSGRTCACGTSIYVESAQCHTCANRSKNEERRWPEDRRTRVRKMAYNGFSFTEIASQEQITRGAVSGWLYRQTWYRELRRSLAVSTMALLIIGGTAQAHDPAAKDAEWYGSLQTPSGGSCCGGGPEGDCDEIGTKDYDGPAADGSYEAKFRGRAVHVSKFQVLKRADNPTGGPVLCYHPFTSDLVPPIICFILPAQS